MNMRAICKVCKGKDNCFYIKNGKTSDCIDVQTSDYGYEEAVEKAKIAYCQQHCPHIFKGEYCWIDKDDDNCGGFNAFAKAMEEQP